MSRFDVTLFEIKQVRPQIEYQQSEFKYLDAEFDIDPHTMLSAKEQKYFKIGAGDLSIKAWIKKNDLRKCLKRDSTCLLTVGELSNGAWKKGVKFYWLQPIV